MLTHANSENVNIQVLFQDLKEATENRREVEKNQEVQSDVVIEVPVVAEIQVLVQIETEVGTKVLVKVETRVPDERIEVLARREALEGVGTGAPVVGTVAPEEVGTEVLKEVGIEVLGEGEEVQEEVGIGAPAVVREEVGIEAPVVAPEEVGIEVLAVVQGEVVEAPEDRVLKEASHRIVFEKDETVEEAEMMKGRKYI